MSTRLRTVVVEDVSDGGEDARKVLGVAVVLPTDPPREGQRAADDEDAERVVHAAIPYSNNRTGHHYPLFMVAVFRPFRCQRRGCSYQLWSDKLSKIGLYKHSLDICAL